VLKRLLYRTHATVYRFDRWFKQRFTSTGMLMVGLLLVAGVFGVNTRANLAYQLAMLAIALLTVAMLSAAWFRPAISIRRRLPRYASDGDPLHYVIEVENHSRRIERGLLLQEQVRVPPLSAIGDDGPIQGYTRWSAALRRRVGAQPRPLALPDIPAGGRIEVSMQWRPLRRGYVRLAGCALLRPDPLGLFCARKRIKLRESLLVIPKRYPVNWTAWTGELRDKPGGLSQSASTSGVEEFASLREYRPGDPLRHIDWKGWARFGVPIVKEYFETCFVRQALILDTWLPSQAQPARFEAAVSVAASFVAAGPAAMRGVALDLIFVGTSVHRVSTGAGVGTPDGVLEALACVEAQTQKNFAMLKDCVSERAGELSACVCVLLAWDQERREFIADLRRMGVPVLVLLVDDAEPDPSPDPGPMADEPRRFKVLSPQGLAEALAGLAS
jgi:uncharacterized protein (DUF58 family)